MTDHDLVQLILKGHTEQYKELIQKYQKLIYFTILKIVNGAKDEADDLTQEVFISVYRSLSYFRHDASFSTWLVRIATNRAIDYKKRKRHRTTSDEQLLSEITNREDEPLSLLVKKESNQLIKKRVDQLPLIYQQVIQDHYFNQLSYQEIALKEGVEIKTVESRLYRARGMLKNSWKEEKTIEL